MEFDYIKEKRKPLPERIAKIRQTMEMVHELEAVRTKYGFRLSGADTTPVEIQLGDLEVEIYGDFANAAEARLRHLEEHSKREGKQ
jgi:hypothetical protein